MISTKLFNLQAILGENFDKSEITKIEINKKMISSCKSANMRYRIFREEQEKTKKLTEREKRKLELKEELTGARQKRCKLEKTIERYCKEADELALRAQDEKAFILLEMSNKMRDKVTEFNKEIKETDDHVNNLQNKLKELV